MIDQILLFGRAGFTREGIPCMAKKPGGASSPLLFLPVSVLCDVR